MKNILITISLLCVFEEAGYSQQPEIRMIKNRHLYVGVIDLFYNTLQLGYEKKLSNQNTIALLGGFKLSQQNREIERIGGNGEIQYRINLLYDKEAFSKIVKNYTTFAYFAPFFQYRYEDIRDKEYTEPFPALPKDVSTLINSYFGGVGFGFRLTGAENRFCLNVFAGGGLKYAEVNGGSGYTGFTEVGYTGIAPKIELHLGVAL